MPLFVVPTPIGNLEDITLRAINVLRKVDVIACEDTRKTAILLQRYHIHVPTVSYYAHNEQRRTEQLLERLRRGEKVALVSDAGTPGISDPGSILIQAAISEGFEIDILPGATAFVPALIHSGFETHPFTFYGFLPDKKGERRETLENLQFHPFPLIFYLSPHKAQKHMADILEILGNRRAALVREISKIYQEARRANLGVILSQVEAEGVRGELVLVVDKPPEQVLDDDQWKKEAEQMVTNGISQKEVVKFIIQRYPVAKNAVKDWLIQVRQKIDR
jgi:16S rRNA (cytidine1402-2'-O)-methyltransferase